MNSTQDACSQPRIVLDNQGLGLTDTSYSSTNLPPWIYPPPQFDPVDQIGYVSLPAIGATTTVVSYTVSQGKNGIILAYANNFIGGDFVEGSGGVVWQILRNGVPIKFYERILASLGTPQSPTRHPSGFRLFENDIIKIVITNVSIPFSGQLIGGRLSGWQYPKKYEDARIGV
jgi:hypothetical protein